MTAARRIQTLYSVWFQLDAIEESLPTRFEQQVARTRSAWR